MRRLLTLALLLAAQTAHGALIHMGVDPPAVPEDYIFVDVELENAVFPRGYFVRELVEDPQDWQRIPYYTDTGGLPWKIYPFWVAIADAGFSFRLNVHIEYVDVSLAEFLTAGDETLTLILDVQLNAEEPWHVLHFDSPNLGLVERTYERQPGEVPEPALFASGLRSGWQACLIFAVVVGLIEFVKRAGRRT